MASDLFLLKVFYRTEDFIPTKNILRIVSLDERCPDFALRCIACGRPSGECGRTQSAAGGHLGPRGHPGGIVTCWLRWGQSTRSECNQMRQEIGLVCGVLARSTVNAF